jgi:3',5'-cyclic AMP phosphodiesterase CpdA
VPALVAVAGDVAYANGDLSAPPFNGWDRFQALLSPIAASVPVAVCEGNHDGEWDEHFVPLRARFAPPARWYTIDRGAVRIIMLSTEDNNAVELEEKQMQFLRRALRAARLPDSGVQWLIVVGHRPLFDSNRLYGDQTEMRAQLVPLFDEHAVDLYIGGHQHDYERTFRCAIAPAVPVQLVTVVGRQTVRQGQRHHLHGDCD